ncbi:hypothetical protein ISS05_02950 [Candidatus Woesearchaeota archaeon]|nr:hypothetical protein [Candidatus Woesearchaeota archaeon]
MNKKAIELSINFLVILVISLTIFGFGIKFLYDLFQGANDLEDLTFEDIDNQIAELMCGGNERVCLPNNHLTIKRGEFEPVGMKIINMIDTSTSTTFSVTVTHGSFIDENGVSTQGTFTNVDCVPSCSSGTARTESIKNNEERDFGVGINVETGAVSGTYIFDVKVEYINTTNALIEYYTDKLYIEIP